MTSSLFRNYKTNTALETGGVEFELFDNRITLARMSQSNKEFEAFVAKATKPYRALIAAGKFPPEQDAIITKDAFVEKIVKSWKVKQGDVWVDGIPQEDGTVVPFTKDAVRTLIEKLPDLYQQLLQLATNGQHYLEDAGTSELGKN